MAGVSRVNWDWEGAGEGVAMEEGERWDWGEMEMRTAGGIFHSTHGY